MSATVLSQLASLLGITVSWSPGDEVEAARREAGLLHLLRGVGLPLEDSGEAEALLGRMYRSGRQMLLDPVLVVHQQDLPLRFSLRLGSNEQQRYRWIFREEAGAVHEGSFRPRELEAAAPADAGSRDGPVVLLDSGVSPGCGYHELTVFPVQGGEEKAGRQCVVVAPERCYVPPGVAAGGRVFGLSAHLHAMHSRTSWGIGDFADLHRLLAWGASQGAGTIHLAPVGVPVRQSFPNAYAPSCRSRLNEIYLHIEDIADFQESDRVREYVGDARFQARLANLRGRRRIDYRAVAGLKGEVLRLLWDHFRTSHLNPATERGEAFRSFQEQGGEDLLYYGVFRALEEKQGERGDDSGGHGQAAGNITLSLAEAAEYARRNADEIMYRHYLLWQAELQVAGLGRRSTELGLKVGLLCELPAHPGAGGFESWYYGRQLLGGACVGRRRELGSAIDPAEGLPLFAPTELRQVGYKPFIEALRRIMRHAGGVILRSPGSYDEVPLRVDGQDERLQARLHFPFVELMDIVALESSRNRCLVVADSVAGLAQSRLTELEKRDIYALKGLFQGADGQCDWLAPAAYPPRSVVSAASPFLAGLTGLWAGRDIAVKAEHGLFCDQAEEERQILQRASARAHFLIELTHAGLLPEGFSADPATVGTFVPSLAAAAQHLLARSRAGILLVSLADLMMVEAQVEPPALADQSFWLERYPVELEGLFASREAEELFARLGRERGAGVVHPSALWLDRRKRQGLRLPIAFYRLQLSSAFTFRQAADLVPYLRGLGVSHCYLSPILMARPGSPHGYDIIDHGRLNPEIGSREDFEHLVGVVEQHGMALLLDIVPNHMGIGSDNRWWMDVLENGESSAYARYFDINWQPQQQELTGRVLLPVLGDHYGRILEECQLVLCFQDHSGTFFFSYHEQRFPIDPQTYGIILGHDLQRLSDRVGEDDNGFLELQNLIRSFENLPARSERQEERLRLRRRDKEIAKRILARLCGDMPQVLHFIAENVILVNGEQGVPESFALLHDLLERQAYRLAYWRVAADEINYRRFFDINDLAGLRIEEGEVFGASHRLIQDLVATGKIDGLRVDHPDGLYDPAAYFGRLQAAAAGETLEAWMAGAAGEGGEAPLPLYVVAEKILADFEHLPASWPICGTVGYDFANLLNGLFVDGSAERELSALYHRFIGRRRDFAELVYASKKLIIHASMAGELNVLTTLLYRLAQASRYSRDFTLNRLREGLVEVVACFPVYRTYVAAGTITAADRQVIERAVSRAEAQQKIHDVSVFAFIKSVLLGEYQGEGEALPGQLDFVMKFQQYTGPVMAKGLEDTSFYIYNRLLSLNEVGGDPRRFGVSLAAFHRRNRERLAHWPGSMLSSSTHDSKRSEDVRARLNVLAETVPRWHRSLYQWSRQNRRFVSRAGAQPAPCRNDEYAFYQNLLGLWPQASPAEQERRQLIDRLTGAMLKGCREAKMHTSWIAPNHDYETGVAAFVKEVLGVENNAFVDDFHLFAKELSWFGWLNGLSQVLLKLVCPGIPDIYQGTETWRCSLVDPDNRRPVDFARRREMLAGISARLDGGGGMEQYQAELLAHLGDGRAKMYVILQALRLRNRWPEVFARGAYQALAAGGEKSMHVCAFARIWGRKMVLAAVPRFFLRLTGGSRIPPLGEEVWGDGTLVLPADRRVASLAQVFSPDPPVMTPAANGSPPRLALASLFRSWPVALLYGTVAPTSAKEVEL